MNWEIRFLNFCWSTQEWQDLKNKELVNILLLSYMFEPPTLFQYIQFRSWPCIVVFFQIPQNYRNRKYVGSIGHIVRPIQKDYFDWQSSSLKTSFGLVKYWKWATQCAYQLLDPSLRPVQLVNMIRWDQLSAKWRIN